MPDISAHSRHGHANQGWESWRWIVLRAACSNLETPPCDFPVRRNAPGPQIHAPDQSRTGTARAMRRRNPWIDHGRGFTGANPMFFSPCCQDSLQPSALQGHDQAARIPVRDLSSKFRPDALIKRAYLPSWSFTATGRSAPISDKSLELAAIEHGAGPGRDRTQRKCLQSELGGALGTWPDGITGEQQCRS